jgi:hypothetical protein
LFSFFLPDSSGLLLIGNVGALSKFFLDMVEGDRIIFKPIFVHFLEELLSNSNFRIANYGVYVALGTKCGSRLLGWLLPYQFVEVSMSVEPFFYICGWKGLEAIKAAAQFALADFFLIISAVFVGFEDFGFWVFRKETGVTTSSRLLEHLEQHFSM